MRTFIVILILVIATSGCSGPTFWLPGGTLSGPESAYDSAKIPADAQVIQLETNPQDPYSVNIGFRRINGEIYIDPAPERKWYQYIQADPNVRLRFEGSDDVLRALTVVESDPQVIQQFEADRIVLRFTSR